MKKVLIIFVLLIFATATVAFFLEEEPLLTEEDYLYEREDNKRPAISIPETGEKFYNHWHCLDSNQIEITTVEINYGGLKKSPTIYGFFEGKNVEYTIDPDRNWDVNKILNDWKSILEKAEKICIFSVFLQNTPDGDLRYIERIKTDLGSWDRNDEEYLLKDEKGVDVEEAYEGEGEEDKEEKNNLPGGKPGTGGSNF